MKSMSSFLYFLYGLDKTKYFYTFYATFLAIENLPYDIQWQNEKAPIKIIIAKDPMKKAGIVVVMIWFEFFNASGAM